MAWSVEAIEDGIRRATEAGFRERMLAQGQARAMVWKEGLLPADAPNFSPLLSHDLLSYGYSLLSYGLRLLETGEANRTSARVAFEHAGDAIEAVVAKGIVDEARDFHRLAAACAFHLGGFSARAFSLIRTGLDDANLSVGERCLGLLVLRHLDELESHVAKYRLENVAGDDRLVGLLVSIDARSDSESSGASDESDGDQSSEVEMADVVDLALTDGYLGALATALLAFERGERSLIEEALTSLRVGLAGSGELNCVSQWWLHRLTIFLIGELWDASFHNRLSSAMDDVVSAKAWKDLRDLFVASMYRRSRAEIDLWPSQLEAASRALDVTDNMVVSLPTSAGKTRIAELCILACLATGKRAVFVTPLRALSAQTETSLNQTFGPLGKTVSSLYGAIGVSEVDEDFLANRDIIVSTPEKLDFALRSDPSLLDDVGLVVLDEGHMIGLGEREVRYEVQIQRLLRRPDADQRRVVCLSAILPDGDKLADFAKWLTRDSASGVIQHDWRPTRLRFGEVQWRGDHARLEVSIGGERPFVPRFLNAKAPPAGKGRRRKHFPSDQRELCLATAWRLVEDGQSVLIFCPLRKSVEPFAQTIVDLHKRGFLPSVLEQDANRLKTALAIGAEWLGADHPLLKCLTLGVAVHHGALPAPYRREIERLLREGVLKITVSSPTLAQGLNLSATALLFHSLHRNKELIDISEFRNVVGRAGRAFVDVEGLALYPMFDDQTSRRRTWEQLIADDGGREMESGLVRLLATLLQRMAAKLGTSDRSKMVEYLANNSAWTFPTLSSESSQNGAIAAARWKEHLTTLDTAILSMLGEHDVPDDEIEARLETVLESSLWSRRLARRNDATQAVLRAGLVARAKFIWARCNTKQRRGYFLAGVGFDTGQALDAKADDLLALLTQANGNILCGEEDEAVDAITKFAEVIFTIPPFKPANLPSGWKAILEAWLKGKAIAELGGADANEVLKFVEDGLVYRLPWGMESVRVRALAHDEPDAFGFSLDDVELGVAVAAVESGTLDRAAAILMRAGFNSRTAAIKAVTEGDGAFDTASEMRDWLRSDAVVALGEDPSWPTDNTHALWTAFVGSLTQVHQRRWQRSRHTAAADWDEHAPEDGAPLRVHTDEAGASLLLSSDYERLGKLSKPLKHSLRGLVTATATSGAVDLQYVGPEGSISAGG